MVKAAQPIRLSLRKISFDKELIQAITFVKMLY